MKNDSKFLATVAMVLIAVPAFADAPRPNGPAPSISTKLNLRFPNSQAILQSAFVPGLDEGFVPQGLAPYGVDFLLSGYMFGRSSCRVYWIERSNLSVAQQYDLPIKCNHAGGIAVSPQGQIAIAEAHKLLVWTPHAGSISPLSGIAEIAMTGNLRGTFLSTSSQGLVIGSYQKEQAITTAETFRWSILNNSNVSSQDSASTVNLLPQTQGAAEVGEGFWTSSQGNPNIISYIAKDGTVRKSFPFLRGLQGVVSGDDGTIWTVSESGSGPYVKRSDIYPSIMQIDLSKLTGQLTRE